MEEVTFNSVILIEEGPLRGFHRVLLATRRADRVLLFKLGELKESPTNIFRLPKEVEGTKKKKERAKTEHPLWVMWEDP